VSNSLNGDTGRKRTFIIKGRSANCGVRIGRSSMKPTGTKTKIHRQFLKTILFKIQFLKALRKYFEARG
jgi:hypothetical protein